MTLERQRSKRDRAEKSRSRVRESDEPAFPEPGVYNRTDQLYEIK